MRALIANSRGPASLAEIAAELGPHIIPATVDRALDADIIFFAVGFLRFKEVAAKRSRLDRKDRDRCDQCVHAPRRDTRERTPWPPVSLSHRDFWRQQSIVFSFHYRIAF